MKEVMIGPIDTNLRLPELPRPKTLDKGSEGASFGEILKDAISTTNQLQKQSDLEIRKLMAGESEDLHATLIAVQQADLSFQMMMQVRNKLVQAYQEITRMQV
jgi:flagellar hook-basal body complex protein FliE